MTKKSFLCPLIKMCHRFPYEEPSKAEESDAEEQCNGVDVEQAVQAQGQPLSFISYTRIALFIRLVVTRHLYSNIFDIKSISLHSWILAEGLPAQGGLLFLL